MKGHSIMQNCVGKKEHIIGKVENYVGNKERFYNEELCR